MDLKLDHTKVLLIISNSDSQLSVTKHQLEGISTTPLDGMLIHFRVTLSIIFSGTNFTPGQREKYGESKVSHPKTQCNKNSPVKDLNPDCSICLVIIRYIVTSYENGFK